MAELVALEWPELAYFLYPGLRRRKGELTFADNDAEVTAKARGDGVVVMPGDSDVRPTLDLRDRRRLVDYMETERGFRHLKTVVSWFSRARAEDAYHFIKQSLGAGDWDRDFMLGSSGVYRLYDAASKCRHEAIVEEWFRSESTRGAGASVACLLSFVRRARDKETGGTRWMKAALARASRMCDLSDEAVTRPFESVSGRTVGEQGLLLSLSVGRSL